MALEGYTYEATMEPYGFYVTREDSNGRHDTLVVVPTVDVEGVLRAISDFIAAREA